MIGLLVPTLILVEPEELGQLMSFLLQRSSLVEARPDEVIDLLSDRFGSSKRAVDAKSLDQATRMAVLLWPMLDGSYRVLIDSNDLFLEAINNPLGHVGRLAVSILSRQRNDFNRSLTEDPELEHLLGLIVADADGKRVLGAVILTFQLPFLLAVAPEWTNKHLIPLLNWTRNKETALALWTGYFHSSQLPRLTNAFLDGLSQSFDNIVHFDETTRRKIPKYVIPLLQEAPDALESSWLISFLQGSFDSDRALMWQHLQYSLGDSQKKAEKNIFDEMWLSWGKKLVERRLTGGPDLETEEWRAIIDLFPFLDACFAEAVNLLERGPRAPKLQHGPKIFYWLISAKPEGKLDHLWQHPNDLARYLLYIHSDLEPSVYWLSELDQAISRLGTIDGVQASLLSRLKNRYIELGGRTKDFSEQA